MALVGRPTLAPTAVDHVVRPRGMQLIQELEQHPAQHDNEKGGPKLSEPLFHWPGFPVRRGAPSTGKNSKRRPDVRSDIRAVRPNSRISLRSCGLHSPRQRIFFRVKFVLRGLALGGPANSMARIQEMPGFSSLTGEPQGNFVAA